MAKEEKENFIQTAEKRPKGRWLLWLALAVLLIGAVLFVLWRCGVLFSGGEEPAAASSAAETAGETAAETPPPSSDAASSEPRSRGTVTAMVDVLDIGQGLGVLIRSGDEVMLIDGGDADHASRVVSYLKNCGVTHLNVLIATHYDGDHINGSVGALAAFGADAVYGPDYEADSRVYHSFMRRIAAAGLTVIHPVPGEGFPFGNGWFTFFAPEQLYEIENDNSLCLRFTDGTNSVLISGDAQEASETMMVLRFGKELGSDIYVAGHHGSHTSSTRAFLNAIRPTYTVVSCGRNNDYGHPHGSTMLRIRASGTELFRTDLQGDITFLFTEDGIICTKQPTDDWSSGGY